VAMLPLRHVWAGDECAATQHDDLCGGLNAGVANSRGIRRAHETDMLDFLGENPEGRTAVQAAEAIGINDGTARRILIDLRDAGLVVSAGHLPAVWRLV